MPDFVSRSQAEAPEATGSWKPGPVALPDDGDTPTTFARSSDSLSQKGQEGATAAAPLALPEAGDSLDAFTLIRMLGVGGMGAVFLARDNNLHRDVALKVLPPEQASDPEVVQRFFQEGRAAARLDHDNIARAYCLGQDRGYSFIAFEYIEGSTLRQRVVQGGPLPAVEAINCTLQIAGALLHASSRGVVHRDIKPSNILLTPDGRAKLVDMGLARRFERGGVDDGLTQSGMTLGTFDYISPEQARDPRDVDVRGDLYSLGCTLFFMLAGRPPFPDGTVLQKLLQHQEEAPPEIRTLNPAVPPALAAVLTKLMAKDRDRRYQTPELLVRDLLLVAGALGFRPASSESFLVTAPAPSPLRWERHLVWGVPAVSLAVVVLLLVWNTQTAGVGSVAIANLAPSLTPRNPPRSAPPPAISPRLLPDLEPARPAPVRTDASVAPPPQEVLIRTSRELTLALESEASGSTLILADEAPFLLPSASAPRTSTRDLTLRAAPDARPIVRFAASASSSVSEAALLWFGAGRVSLDGITLQLDSLPNAPLVAAVRVEGTELTLRRCLIRRASPHADDRAFLAFQIQNSAAASDDRPPAVLLDASHVDGRMIGFKTRGRVDLQVRDSTFGPGGPVVWFDNAPAGRLVPSELTCRHVSIQAGQGPVLRSTGTAARVAFDDSVVATSGDVSATLVASDAPDQLVWRGRGNLYRGIDTYLQPSGLDGTAPAIRSLDLWRDGLQSPREVGSTTVSAPVWAEASPLGLDPSQNFALAASVRTEGSVGARRGPTGPILAAPRSIAAIGDIPPRLPEPPGVPKSEVPKQSLPLAEAASTVVVEIPREKPPAGESAVVEEIRPMLREEDLPPRGDEHPPVEQPPVVVASPEKIRSEPPPVAPPARASKTAAELVDAIAGLEGKGGEVHLPADADFSLATLEVRGQGRRTLLADPGASRPQLRFRPITTDLRRTSNSPAFFQLRGGSLELKGVDILLEASEIPTRGAWTAFAIQAGTELKLVDCTVTVEGDRRGGGVVAVIPGEADPEMGLGETSLAQVRVSNSLIRSGGDFLDVTPGRRVAASFSNVVVAAGGTLVHGHGLPLGGIAEGISLTVEQTTARVGGGLIWLESLMGEPELPIVDVVARDSILDTLTGNTPLILVESQDALDTLSNQITWDGQGIIYHQIQTYRRDQSAMAGTLPNRYDRTNWKTFVGSKDTQAVHGDARFAEPWDSERRLTSLARRDVRLVPERAGMQPGPDLEQIPPVPQLPGR